MNRKNIKAISNGFFFLATVAMMTSCHADIEPEEIKATPEKELMASDLQEFSQRHSFLIGELLRFNDQDSENTRASHEEQFSQLFDEISENVNNLTKKYDLIADLPDEKQQCLNEDSLSIMQNDQKAIIAYLQKYKSKEFCHIYNNLITNPLFIITPQRIIDDQRLYLNEKVSLLLIIPVLNDYEISLGRLTRSQASDKCLDEYYSQRKDCAESFALSCLGSCIGGIGGLAIGAAIAAINLDDCLDTARERYIDCQNLNQ